MAGRRDFDPERFAALASYVGARSRSMVDGDNPIKLQIVMWFADFDAFRRLGQSLTGATWVKMPWGAAPYHAGRPAWDYIAPPTRAWHRFLGTVVATCVLLRALREAT